MKLGIGKPFTCEDDMAEIKKSQKQKMQWRNYVKSKLDDQENIREIVAKYPYKKDNDNA